MSEEKPQVFEVEPSSTEFSLENERKINEEYRDEQGYSPPKSRGRPKKSTQSSKSSSEVINREQLENIITGAMQTLGVLLDESFEVLDTETQKQDPRVSLASAQMLPWAQKYGGVLISSAPWIGLITGAIILVGPSLSQTIEICAGVRKPRILRNTPTDIYTEKYKAAVQVVNGQKNESIAKSN